MTPTARTLRELRRLGYRCQVVEQTVPHTFIKRDLFGFVDIIAVGSSACGRKTLAVQATSGSNVGARLEKIRTECQAALKDCLWAGWRVEVWGWRRLKVKRGGKAVRWEVDRREITHSNQQEAQGGSIR